MKDHCKLLLSCRRRQTLGEIPFFLSPDSASVPTSPQSHLPVSLQQHNMFPRVTAVLGCNDLFYVGLRVSGKWWCLTWGSQHPHTQDALQPQTLQLVPDAASCVSIILSCRPKVLFLITKPLFWQRNRALGIHWEAEVLSHLLSKSSMVKPHESPNPLVPGTVIGRSWVLCIYATFMPNRLWVCF